MSSCMFLMGMGTVRGGILGGACFPSPSQRSPGAQAGWESPRKGLFPKEKKMLLKIPVVFPETLVHINIHAGPARSVAVGGAKLAP